MATKTQRISGQEKEQEGIPGPRGPKGARGERGPLGLQGPMGEPGVPAEIRTKAYILTDNDIINKKLPINDEVFSNWIQLIPDAGPAQRPGIDFTYDKTAKTVTWNNMGLDGVLETNDRVEIQYLYKFK